MYVWKVVSMFDNVFGVVLKLFFWLNCLKRVFLMIMIYMLFRVWIGVLFLFWFMSRLKWFIGLSLFFWIKRRLVFVVMKSGFDFLVRVLMWFFWGKFFGIFLLVWRCWKLVLRNVWILVFMMLLLILCKRNFWW